jgi:peptidoglycan/LPS O-acetylase OafA/YrhL
MSEQSLPSANEPLIKGEESIFNEVYDLAPYEKTMKNARIWLYVIAAIQLIMGIVEFNTIEDSSIAPVAFGIDALIALTFLGLGLWSKNKPVIAFTIALAFYVIITIGFAIISGDFTVLVKGIILKIVVVGALIKANKDAREYEAIKQSLGEEV